MNLLALLASESDPASRLRILQYAPYLEKTGIRLHPHYSLPAKDTSPAPWTQTFKQITGINPWRTWNVLQDLGRLPLLLKQSGFDAIWESRMLLPYLSGNDRFINKPVVFDIDDAIWLPEGEAPTGKAMTRADTIFAGNEYLAGWSRRFNANTVLVPTTIDLAAYAPRPNGGPFNIGWIGTAPNFKYLGLALPAIRDFLRTHTDARFTVVSGKPPDNIAFDDDRIVFKKWTADSEVDLINDFSVGIMPLADDEWTRGKCGFKLLQYMACGKPVVASPVGVNVKLLSARTGFAAGSETEWSAAFDSLHRDEEMRTEMGMNGRRLVAQEYDTAIWAPVVASHLLKLKK